MTVLFSAKWDATSSVIDTDDGADASSPSTLPSTITLVENNKDRGMLLSGKGTIHINSPGSQFLIGNFTSASDVVFADMLVWFSSFPSPTSGNSHIEQRLLVIRGTPSGGSDSPYANIVARVDTSGNAYFRVRNGSTVLATETDPDYRLKVDTLYRIGLYQNKTTGVITGYWVIGNDEFDQGKSYSTPVTINAQASKVYFGATDATPLNGRLDVVRVVDSATDLGPWHEVIEFGGPTPLQDELLKLRPGDILKLDPGQYDGWVLSSSTVPYQAIPGNPIKVEGDDSINRGTWIAGINAHCRITNAHSWIWSYVNIDGSQYPGTQYDNLIIVRGDDWIWERSEIRYSLNNFKALFAVEGDGTTNGADNGVATGWTIRDCWIHSNEGINWLPQDPNEPPGDANYQDHCIYVLSCRNGTVERCILSDTPNGRAVKVGLTSSQGLLPQGTIVRDNTFVWNIGEGHSKVSYSATDNLYEYCVMVGPTKNDDGDPEPDWESIGHHNLDGDGTNNIVANCRAWLSTGVVDVLPSGDLADGGGNAYGDPGLNNRFEPTALVNGSDEFTHGHLKGKTSYTQWDGPPTAFRRTARFRRIRR